MDRYCSYPRPVRDLRPGDHAWLAYANEEERRHVMAGFVRDGLRSGEKVVYLADPDAGADAVPGLPCEHADGLLSVVPFDRGGGAGPEAALEALAAEAARAGPERYRAVRVTADLTWAVRRPGGLATLLDREREWDRLVAPSVRLIAVCQFDRRACDAAALAGLRACHGVRVDPNPEFEDSVLKIVRTFQPTGLSLRGELDASRHTVLDEALSTVLSGAGGREVHLDLAGLGFIDLGAINLLADAAARRRGAGPLVLDSVSPQLRTVMDTVGWSMLPGLRVAGVD
ncbi:STAS domain-containing protein [Actinomadura sp. J1-007]|nr:STAS domain-containing protein [Actinomadura sp. J1-007]